MKLEAAEALLASKDSIIELLQNSARLQTEAHGTPSAPAPAPLRRLLMGLSLSRQICLPRGLTFLWRLNVPLP